MALDLLVIFAASSTGRRLGADADTGREYFLEHRRPPYCVVSCMYSTLSSADLPAGKAGPLKLRSIRASSFERRSTK